MVTALLSNGVAAGDVEGRTLLKMVSVVNSTSRSRYPSTCTASTSRVDMGSVAKVLASRRCAGSVRRGARCRRSRLYGGSRGTDDIYSKRIERLAIYAVHVDVHIVLSGSDMSIAGSAMVA